MPFSPHSFSILEVKLDINRVYPPLLSSFLLSHLHPRTNPSKQLSFHLSCRYQKSRHFIPHHKAVYLFFISHSLSSIPPLSSVSTSQQEMLLKSATLFLVLVLTVAAVGPGPECECCPNPCFALNGKLASPPRCFVCNEPYFPCGGIPLGCPTYAVAVRAINRSWKTALRATLQYTQQYPQVQSHRNHSHQKKIGDSMGETTLGKRFGNGNLGLLISFSLGLKGFRLIFGGEQNSATSPSTIPPTIT